MQAADFIRKWSDSVLRERQAAQEHFIDLCRLIGEKSPAEADPLGETYCFERGAEKTGGGDGWADVWRKGCFAWEYKGKHKDLKAALRQVQAYALDLQNPPYLVVCDMERIEVHTNWTNTISKTHVLTLEDLREPAKLELLRQVFNGSEALKPGISPQELTAKAAASFGALGKRLQERGHPPRAVAHFLNQLIFCMFAEDAGLLPDGLFTRTIKATQSRPAVAQAQLAELFTKMATEAEEQRFFGPELIKWFNGGLFDRTETLPLTVEDLKTIGDVAGAHDWSEIDPAIFGTLFEQALTATRERPALGAHYTDREKILKIVEPVIVRPLTAEREAAFVEIAAHAAAMKAADEERKAVQLAAAEALRTDPATAKAEEPNRRKELTAIAKRREASLAAAQDRLEAFLKRLRDFRVLDPACGSGNFLYVALHELKDIELRAIVDADRLGLGTYAPQVGLSAVRGIEIEPYAAELARVTLWIGDLQWMKRNGYTNYREPILDRLDHIDERDALMVKVVEGGASPTPSTASRSPSPAQAGEDQWIEAQWPEVDVIIGNPPFLGGKRMRDGLGDAYVERLFALFKGRVPAEADFVVYWVEKGWAAIKAGRAQRVGLVTTNSIRGGANRKVMDAIADAEAIREAWADEPWILNGAAVRVSMIGYGAGFIERRLEGRAGEHINADLTGNAVDLTKAVPLKENAGVAFMGDTKGGAFDVSGEQAREWLLAKGNPNGRPNSDVLKPWANGADLTRRAADKWIIDFGWTMSEGQAALYGDPFRFAVTHIQPERADNNREHYALYWWRHVEPRPGMIAAIEKLSRFILTPRVAKHRLFCWMDFRVLPDSATIAIARDHDTTFGILHSRFHELWSLRLGTWLGVGNDPRYTPSTTFETFPFPEGLTPNIPATDYADDPRAIAIAAAAERLNALREAWLNPPDLTVRVAEVVPGYPDRILPRDEAAAKILKKRTLTNLYNERPAWLVMAHKALDDAVADAYGWPRDLSDDEVLERLFTLNQERAAAEASNAPATAPRRSRKRKAGREAVDGPPEADHDGLG